MTSPRLDAGSDDGTGFDDAVGPDDDAFVDGDGDGGEGAPERRHTARYVAIALGVVLALLVAVFATRESYDARIESSPLVGQPAPALTGQSIVGEPVRFDIGGGSGEWTVVNFFASWCTPCKVEHPELVTFSQRHALAGDARVVSVVFDDERADVERFFAERGGDWPVLDDPDGRVALDWGVLKLPESYLVDPDGLVRGKIAGGVTADFLDGVLAEAQGGGEQ